MASWIWLPWIWLTQSRIILWALPGEIPKAYRLWPQNKQTRIKLGLDGFEHFSTGQCHLSRKGLPAVTHPQLTRSRPWPGVQHTGRRNKMLSFPGLFKQQEKIMETKRMWLRTQEFIWSWVLLQVQLGWLHSVIWIVSYSLWSVSKGLCHIAAGILPPPARKAELLGDTVVRDEATCLTLIFSPFSHFLSQWNPEIVIWSPGFWTFHLANLG